MTMKWVRIGKCHINMAEVKFFYWKDGEISIHIRIEERLHPRFSCPNYNTLHARNSSKIRFLR